MSAKIYDIIDTENGVKFHVNRMEDNLLIDDINVKPGIKTVKFDFGDICYGCYCWGKKFSRCRYAHYWK